MEKSHCWNSLQLYRALQSFLKFGKDIVVLNIMFFLKQIVRGLTLWLFPISFPQFPASASQSLHWLPVSSHSHVCYITAFASQASFHMIFFQVWLYFFWCGLIFFIIGDTCNFSQKNSIMSIALVMGRNILNAELQEKSWTRFILCIVYNPELMFDVAGSWASQLPVLEPICSARCSTLCTATGWDEWMTSSFQATRFCHSVLCYCNALTL